MRSRLVPLVLVVAASVADRRGTHGAAFYALLAAVPACAVAVVSSFGDLVDRAVAGLDELAPRAEVLAGSLALALVVVSAAARSTSLPHEPVTGLAASAMVASFVLLSAHVVLAWAPRLRGRTLLETRSTHRASIPPA